MITNSKKVYLLTGLCLYLGSAMITWLVMVGLLGMANDIDVTIGLVGVILAIPGTMIAAYFVK